MKEPLQIFVNELALFLPEVNFLSYVIYIFFSFFQWVIRYGGREMTGAAGLHAFVLFVSFC